MGSKSDKVDSYIADCSPVHNEALSAIRDLVHEVYPDVVEGWDYNMPTFEVDDVLCAFSSRKNYISLYCNTDAVEKHRAGLGKLDVGKSCIRFRKLEDLNMDTVRTILMEHKA